MQQYAEIIFLIGTFSFLMLFAYLVNKVDYSLQLRDSSNWKTISYIIQTLYACLFLLIALTALLTPVESIYKSAVMVSSVIGLSFLIPAVRKGLAKFISIDPYSKVHTFALLTSVLIPISLFESLLHPMNVSNLQQEDITFASTLSTLWTQNILSALFAILGVGYLSQRDWQQTKERLGIRRLSLSQIGTGIAVAGVLFLLQIILTSLLTKLGLSPEEEVLKVNDALMAPLFNNAIGILSIGFAAALGEELIFRGALQPRFGIILTSILFALTHANYGLSIATIVVLALGFGLGICRQRVSTTYSMVVHASYNILVGVISLFS